MEYTGEVEALAGIRRRYDALVRVLDERGRRLAVAAESKALGPGGISTVSQATGVSRQVIRQGLRELEEPAERSEGRIRRPGGGRKKARDKDPTLVKDLQQLLESTTRGHPETCLRWTCKSVRNLAEELRRGPTIRSQSVWDVACSSSGRECRAWRGLGAAFPCR